jgi:hypothetical protein
MSSPPLHHFAFALAASFMLAGACSASSDNQSTSGSGAGGPSSSGAGGNADCGTCFGQVYTPCNADGTPGTQETCPEVCAPGVGCTQCLPGQGVCIGNEVYECDADGMGTGTLKTTCDISKGEVCSNGSCVDACTAAADKPSNVGCEFWAVDLDQQDYGNDPADAPWGVALSNVGDSQANVTIEINLAAPGEPLDLSAFDQLSVPPGSLVSKVLPTRELDCGSVPNDYNSPGTCLSSRAFRITSSYPIIVYQFNVFENAFSNDASLLLPSEALGKVYRVLGWNAGHPAPIPPPFPQIGGVDRSYVTIVGTKPNTQVTVRPSYKIKGNPPIAATMAGGEIVATIGPFDVLNLETDDGDLNEDQKTIADLSGTLVVSSEPVAVFSGVESTSVPGAHDIPTYPGWSSDDTCCLDHLEDQMFPMESIGTSYVITRSPVRSSGSYQEPDIIRFVGAAEIATVTTSLPAPFDSFTINPGEVKTTCAQQDITVSSDKPVIVGQLLISQGYLEGALTGDPALTVFPPIDQFRNEYVILTPASWNSNHVVVAAEEGGMFTIDGANPMGCVTNAAGTLNGVNYFSHRCPLTEGVHKLSGDKPFGVMAYGYGNAGSYAFAGGADVKKIYDPPALE